jgi:type IV pilus assembly protein PilV
MIEVLVTITIVVIGMWGMMEMQARLHKSEMESYQRTQALILLNDMANSMMANRGNIADYITPTSTYLGVGATCPIGTTLQQTDSRQWCEALKGAAETSGSTDVGAMIGGRGCVEEVLAGRQYMVTVVWQGLTPVDSIIKDKVTCGTGLYDLPAGSDCAANSDSCRRFVTTLVGVADLEDL